LAAAFISSAPNYFIDRNTIEGFIPEWNLPARPLHSILIFIHRDFPDITQWNS